MIESRLPTGLVVSSIERSVEFYCGFLGYRFAGDLPLPNEEERWDRYYEQISAVPGARIRCAYLEAPDGETHIELIEHLDAAPVDLPKRSHTDVGTAILVLQVRGSREIVERMRAEGIEVISDPVPYTSIDGVSSLTTYLRDPDGVAVCLFEGPHQLGRG